MKRRDFIALFAGAAAWMVPARAQAMPVIGYLGSESPERYSSRLVAFRDGLADVGYVEGRNVAIEFRWAEGQYHRLPQLAKELANRQPAVIVAAGGAEVALAAKSATTTIPIVFEMGGDPIALGVVSSLSRPGGNLTGVTSLSVEVSRKRLEFMHEVRPGTKVFAVAVNPASPTSDSQLKNLQAAADSLGLQLVVLKASAEHEFDNMFAAVHEKRAGGLVFSSDPYFAYRSQQLAALAVRHAVPAMTQSRDFPLAGGLMSYGGDFNQSHRQSGMYAGRVLNGQRPSDLPVQRITKVELFINLKAANALGLSFPPSLLSSADRVIE
jgi:putative ABC transport system substrate-binding protein